MANVEFFSSGGARGLADITVIYITANIKKKVLPPPRLNTTSIQFSLAGQILSPKMFHAPFPSTPLPKMQHHFFPAVYSAYFNC